MTRLAISLALLLSLPFAAPVAAQGTDAKQLSERHLKKLRDDINELQNFLKKAQDEHKALVSSLRKSDEDVAKVSQQVESLRNALQEERARLKKLKAEQTTLSQSQLKQQRVLNDIILASYKLGQEPQLKMLLNQQDQPRWRAISITCNISIKRTKLKLKPTAIHSPSSAWLSPTSNSDKPAYKISLPS